MRYRPAPDEQAAIDLLKSRGYVTIRQSTYDNWKRKLDHAHWEARSVRMEADSVRRWADLNHNDMMRLTARLNQVCTAAASLGVPIQDINSALELKN